MSIARSFGGQSPRAGIVPPSLGSAELPWIHGAPAPWALRAQPWICNRGGRVVNDMSLAGPSASNHPKTWSASEIPHPSQPHTRREASPQIPDMGNMIVIPGGLELRPCRMGSDWRFCVVLRPLFFALLMMTPRLPCAARSTGQLQKTWLEDIRSFVGLGRLGIVLRNTSSHGHPEIVLGPLFLVLVFPW